MRPTRTFLILIVGPKTVEPEPQSRRRQHFPHAPHPNRYLPMKTGGTMACLIKVVFQGC